MVKHKIYGIENIEAAALSQFYDAIKQPFVLQAALMPDAHKGYSLPIGAVVATNNVVVPAWVGYDIGCGVCAVKIQKSLSKSLEQIHKEILEEVPVGFNHNKTANDWVEAKHIEHSSIVDKWYKDSGVYQLGTLGGGNHFIEIAEDENYETWVVIHSGSRNLGHKVGSHYMTIASEMHTGIPKAREGHYGLAADYIEGKSYIKDAHFCQEFALENRVQMLCKIEKIVGDFDWTTLINRNHNHVEARGWGAYIHRKGATHAEKGMLGVIPGNMRDGSFIVEGLGNEDSLFSSSHGAGRILGRKAAKQSLDLDEFISDMAAVVSSASSSTLDESPRAYKDIFKVMEEQSDLVKIVKHLTPIINVKG